MKPKIELIADAKIPDMPIVGVVLKGRLAEWQPVSDSRVPGPSTALIREGVITLTSATSKKISDGYEWSPEVAAPKLDSDLKADINGISDWFSSAQFDDEASASSPFSGPYYFSKKKSMIVFSVHSKDR